MYAVEATNDSTTVQTHEDGSSHGYGWGYDYGFDAYVNGRGNNRREGRERGRGTTVEFATMTGASAIVSVVGNGDTPGVLGNIEVGSNDKKERGWSGVGIQGHSPVTREKGKEKLDYSFLEEGSSSSIGSIEDYTTIRCTSSNVRGGSSKPKFIEVSGV